MDTRMMPAPTPAALQGLYEGPRVKPWKKSAVLVYLSLQVVSYVKTGTTCSWDTAGERGLSEKWLEEVRRY